MLALASIGLQLSVAGSTAAAVTGIGFGKSLLAGESTTNPTSIQFGPDRRLYVAQRSGLIKVYRVTRDARNAYRVTATETIASIQSIPNHNDSGAVSSVFGRLVTGMVVVGTKLHPVIYVSSSDPRAGGASIGDTGLDTNSGAISRLTWNGTSWVKRNLVLGLPRSEEVHASNGLQLDPVTNTLYLAQGGNTNLGAPSQVFANLPEYALSAAVLAIDLDAIGAGPYLLPTLNDPDRPGNPDANDPFGGNDGLNQAKVVPGGPVGVYSPGYRNPYDLEITDAGRLYATDNGPNAGQGGLPHGEGPSGSCTNAVSEPGFAGEDRLHLVTGAGYYGGHPNPTRGNSSNTFGGQSPVPAENPIECDFLENGVDNPALTTFRSSTNGIDEYTSSNFGGAMKGDLLAAGWDNFLYRIRLNQAGTAVTDNAILFSNLGERPLDVTAQPDTGPFPGTIWVVDHAASTIVVFEPNDYGGAVFTCAGTDSASLDEDGDGYSNADEIDNGTDPCSAGDVPPDHDGDGVSDRNDPDDDNDGLPDPKDPFAIDEKNGKQTYVPFRITWNPEAPAPGGLAGTGFTGLMTDASTNYSKLFNPARMTVGGAAGVLTIDRIPDGTSYGATNSQRYGFQLGMHAGLSATGPFTVHTRVLAPFAGITPEDDQSLGLFLGRGNQDDYVKLALTANGGAGGIALTREVGGAPTTPSSGPLPMPGPDRVDLYLAVVQSTGSVQASYRVTTGGTTGPRIALGKVTVPTSWFLNNPMGLAVGIVSTSAGPAPPFAGTWDLIEASATPTGARAGSPAGPPARTARAAPPSPLDPGLWRTRRPSGIPRQEVSYVRDGSELFLAGGSTAHQAYDPAANSWRSVKDLPADLDHIQGVEVGGLLYYIGGLLKFPKPAVDTVYIYDPETDSFDLGKPMPAGRERGAGGVAVHDGKIYYAGGLHDGLSVNWFDVYDPKADTWARLPNMPHARDHSHAAIVGDRMYTIAGRSNNVRIGASDAFDFATGTWVSGLAPLPTLRAGFATAAIGTEIYVIGGEGGGLAFDTVEAYDTVHDRWRELSPMPTARHGIQGVVNGGGIYIAAGGTRQGGGGATDVQEVLYPTSARPDGAIRLAGDATFVGGDVYAGNGAGQTRSASAGVGQTRTFEIWLQNDAGVKDGMRVSGPGGGSAFDVTYRLGGADVTADVVAGTLVIARLAPGAARALVLQVTPKAGATGTSRQWLVTGSSTRIPAIRDAVAAVVTVP